MTSHVSDRVLAYCTSHNSVSALLAKDPSRSAASAAKEVFGKEAALIGDDAESQSSKESSSSQSSHRHLPSHDAERDLERALKCGNFGDKRPSDLFLKLWHDVLVTLDKDPMAGMVSPSLMGSTGVIPFTVIGVVEDVCRHMVGMMFAK